jgi:Transposase DDE domain group 1
VKVSKKQVQWRVQSLPMLRFEAQRLTSFSGMILFQALFQRLDLRGRLLRHLGRASKSVAYGLHVLVLQLVVHLLAGFRRLRERDHYVDDPLLPRLIGVQRLADTSTLTRRLGGTDEAAVVAVRAAGRELVLGRITQENLARVTLDFDGSVLTTRGYTEGSAVGYNTKRRGARSDSPLFCTIAQTGQFLDFPHRPGNVHDSNGAKAFMLACAQAARTAAPKAQLETRIDAAFFDEAIIDQLDPPRVDFSVSVPFERFPALKSMIEKMPSWRWIPIDEQGSYAEIHWRPKRWKSHDRMIALRQRVACQVKGPLQLDLFAPRDHTYDYRVIATNKADVSANAVRWFHHGRGTQEGLIGEAKAHVQLDYVPTRRLAANQIFTAAALLAHNLGRELQMATKPRERATSPSRPALWAFETLRTLRQTLVLRAGRLTYPKGTLTLTMNANNATQHDYATYMKALQAAV